MEQIQKNHEILLDKLQNIFEKVLNFSSQNNCFLSSKNDFFTKHFNKDNDCLTWENYEYSIKDPFVFNVFSHENSEIIDLHHTTSEIANIYLEGLKEKLKKESQTELKKESQTELKKESQTELKNSIKKIFQCLIENLITEATEELYDVMIRSIFDHKTLSNTISISKKEDFKRLSGKDISASSVSKFLEKLKNLLSDTNNPDTNNPDTNNPRILILHRDYFSLFNSSLSDFQLKDFKEFLSKENIFLIYHTFDKIRDTSVFYKKNSVIGNLPHIVGYESNCLNEKEPSSDVKHSFYFKYTPLYINIMNKEKDLVFIEKVDRLFF